MPGNFLVSIVMYGWILVVLYIFTRFPAQRAVVVSFALAWMFLPEASFPLPGLPDYTKMSATCYGIIFATILFDAQRLRTFKFGWIDVPMLVWCLCPFASSISNDLSPYDGFSSALSQTVTWGLPYFLGRIYLSNLNGLRLLAMSIFVGGLIYIPFCLFEIRMSPQLHQKVYGFTNLANLGQAIRYGGYRPQVFMSNGLMVGVWMMGATLIGVWLWKTKAIKQLWGIQIKWLVAALFITFILVKSTGSWFLLALGLLILFIGKQFRTPLPLMILIYLMFLYLLLAVNGTFIGDQIVTALHGFVDPERLASYEFRLNNEELLSDKARERLLFGWGGWGRNRIYNEWGRDISITDSLWIIAFGIYGIVGLFSITAALLLPIITFIQRYPVRSWAHRKVAPAATVAVLLALYMLDCILNAMVNPIYALACGGLAGIALKQPEHLTDIPNQPPSTSLPKTKRASVLKSPARRSKPHLHRCSSD
jgi:hypothetical protein